MKLYRFINHFRCIVPRRRLTVISFNSTPCGPRLHVVLLLGLFQSTHRRSLYAQGHSVPGISMLIIATLYAQYSLFIATKLDDFITVSPQNGTLYNQGDTVTVSVTVSSDSPEVDDITITVSGSAVEGAVMQECSNARNCSMDAILTNTGEANIMIAVDYGCTIRSQQNIITAGNRTALRTHLFITFILEYLTIY